MTVTLSGGDGFFDRLGVIIDAQTKLITTNGGELDTEWADISAEYANDLPILGDFETLRDSTQLTGGRAIYNATRALAQRTAVEMVKADNPQPDESPITAVREIIRQMIAASASVDSNEPGSGTTADSANTGNGTVLTYDLNADGYYQEYMRAEDIVVECTTDRQVSGTAGQEVFEYAGEVTVPPWSNDWPGGSGSSGRIQVSSPDKVSTSSGEGNNVVSNGNFETFSVTNTPDDWTIEVGAVGTNVFEEGTTTYRGSKALEIRGDGSSTLTMLSQTVRSASVRNKIAPSSVYLLTCRVAKSASLAAGAFKIGVRDGSDTTLNSGNAEGITVAAATSTSYGAPVEVWFVTPANLPDTITVDIEVTTALTNGESFYIDDLMLVRASQFYTGGPHAVIVPGSTPFIEEDKFTVTVANSGGGLLGRGCDRVFGLMEAGLVIPAVLGGSETVDDAEVA